MKEILNIGCTPYSEDCVQVGSHDYAARATKECKVFLNLLTRHYGTPPVGCELKVQSHPHDFGSYREVCAVFDDDNETASDYAYACEAGVEHWDEEAKIELATGSTVIGKNEDIPVVGVPMTMDSTVDVECPYCGEARRVEPDANYTVTCGCGKKYQLRSEI